MARSLEITHRIRVHAKGFDNASLEELAEHALDSLDRDAKGCALGAVASIETDAEVVEIVFQTLAPNASARAMKMATIFKALSGGRDVQESAEREQVRDLVAT